MADPVCHPMQAVLGGLLIALACGAYMLIVRQVLNPTAALATIASGNLTTSGIACVVGLLGGGAVMGMLMPATKFDEALTDPVRMLVAALCTGFGANLADGTTCAHGICGIARLSRTSLAATFTFVLTATLSAGMTAGDTFTTLKFIPLAPTPPTTLRIGACLALALAANLPGAFLIRSQNTRQIYVSLWAGVTYAIGMAVGGVTRPSVVLGALTPGRVDPTLWILAASAIGGTFVLYRVALYFCGIAEARAADADAAVNRQLILGAALFGTGWGHSGLSPAAHLAIVGSVPFAAHSGPMLATLGGVVAGVRFAAVVMPKRPRANKAQ